MNEPDAEMMREFIRAVQEFMVRIAGEQPQVIDMYGVESRAVRDALEELGCGSEILRNPRSVSPDGATIENAGRRYRGNMSAA